MNDDIRVLCEGPDEDGDIVVTLRGVEHWHLAAHGQTLKQALGRLGEAMMVAAQEVPEDDEFWCKLGDMMQSGGMYDPAFLAGMVRARAGLQPR